MYGTWYAPDLQRWEIWRYFKRSRKLPRHHILQHDSRRRITYNPQTGKITTTQNPEFFRSLRPTEHWY